MHISKETLRPFSLRPRIIETVMRLFYLFDVNRQYDCSYFKALVNDPKVRDRHTVRDNTDRALE